MNRKALERKIKHYFGNSRVDLYKGHTIAGDYGWIIRPFGKNEIYLGRTLRDANEEMQQKIDYREELS